MWMRAAAVADAPAFASIHGRCFEQNWSERSFRTLLQDDVVFGFLAATQPEGGFESCLLARAAGGEGEILTLATVPGARRKGLASLLLNAAIEQVIRRGASGVFLEVRESNREAVRLYAKAGFRTAGRRAGYFVSAGNEPVDALILRRDLPAS